MATYFNLYCFLVYFVSLVYMTNGVAVLFKRDANELQSAEANDEGRVCLNQTPCGWAVYTDNQRVISYFMKNTRCDCPPTLTCGRTDDNFSIKAFVYRCISETHEAYDEADPFAIRPKTGTTSADSN